MNFATFAFLLLPVSLAQTSAQPQANPAVIAKMEELGTVYLTRTAPNPNDPAAKGKLGTIVGLDFRPMAGSDKEKLVELVKELSTLPDLETILLLGSDFTDEAADAIPALPNLVSIQFFNTGITDKGVMKLDRHKKLQAFKYTGMGLSDEGMKALAKIKTLNTVEITDSKISDQGVLALQSLPGLTRLIIENTAATQRSIDQLQNRLPRIEGRRFLR
jgi:hypothetical protein